MTSIKITAYKEGQELIIHQLIKKVYDEFVAVDNSDEGNRFFYDWIKPSAIAGRQRKQVDIWVAFAGTELAGMIEIRDNQFISLLFVDKKYHGQGIAKRLFEKSLKEILRRDSNLDKFLVHASPYSIPVYKKMGFVETDKLQEENGIIYLPMEMKINKLPAG
jgi:GNAT superfamily N-acetyltransferase